MAFGILEPRDGNKLAPGTVLLEDIGANRAVAADGSALKHVEGRPDIVLNPQPSNDPNDPLNWSFAKKINIVSIILFGSCICASTFGPLLNSSLAVISIEMGRPIGDITLISGYQLLVAGASGVFFSAGARKFGKRPVFLVATTLGLIGTIVGSTGKTYRTLLAARVIQGFAIPPYESLVFSIIGDLFFLHERGLYTTIASFILSSVSNLSSVVAGAITQSLDWQYLFYILIAVEGFQLILLFLFVPETTYIRDPLLMGGQHGAHADLTEGALEKGDQAAEVDFEHVDRTKPISSSQGQILKKRTFWEELSVYSPKHQSKENILKLLIGPFVVCSNLGVLWMVVISGVTTSFYVAAAYVTAQIFSFPPYNLNAAGVGYLSTGPAIGGLLGSLAVAVISDPLALWLSRRNGGMFEPEFRLLPIIIGFTGGAGLVGFGAVTENQGNMYVADFMWSMTLFGCAAITAASCTYALDSYRHMSAEIFIAAMVLKNFLFYGYSYFVNNWVASSGPQTPFAVFGGITFACVLSAVPIYVLGKRYRVYWSRHDIMDKLDIQTHDEM